VEGAAEVFAWGLRNPWRWSFDAKTGALWAGDVGQNKWEEIDIVESGENYGWNIKEGTHCYAEDPCDGPYEEPVTEYGRDLGKSVTGGYVYRGETHEALQDVYLFADYLSGRIWGVPNVESGRPYDRVELVDTDKAISSFAQGLDGEIYVIGYAGSIYRLNVSG
jgi:glucose/arabinose dehydrogenase